MARPKKEKELKHNHRIYLRLTDTEYEIVAANAKSANLSLAEYARKQIMNKRVIVKYELVADLPELKKLIGEFGKIGNNLNQIAKKLNENGYVDYKKELPNTMKEVREVWQLLKQYLQKQA